MVKKFMFVRFYGNFGFLFGFFYNFVLSKVNASLAQLVEQRIRNA
jgi:hypothetical protein